MGLGLFYGRVRPRALHGPGGRSRARSQLHWPAAIAVPGGKLLDIFRALVVKANACRVRAAGQVVSKSDPATSDLSSTPPDHGDIAAKVACDRTRSLRAVPVQDCRLVPAWCARTRSR